MLPWHPKVREDIYRELKLGGILGFVDAMPELTTGALGLGGAWLLGTVSGSRLRAVERDIPRNAVWLDTARREPAERRAGCVLRAVSPEDGARHGAGQESLSPKTRGAHRQLSRVCRDEGVSGAFP